MPEIIPTAAFGSRALHECLPETGNQLSRPHRTGNRHVRSSAVSAFIRLLAAIEIGGFALLFAGFVLLLPYIISKLALV